MKKIYIGLGLVLLLALGILAYTRSSTNEAFLNDFVDGRSTREMVEYLEIRGSDSPVFAVAFPDRIELSEGDHTLNLYDDDFYVSIAPYLNFTHA